MLFGKMMWSVTAKEKPKSIVFLPLVPKNTHRFRCGRGPYTCAGRLAPVYPIPAHVGPARLGEILGDPGFNLSVDCLSSGCARERMFAVTADLASFYGGSRTVGEVLRRMRCSGTCGGRVAPRGW